MRFTNQATSMGVAAMLGEMAGGFDLDEAELAERQRRVEAETYAHLAGCSLEEAREVMERYRADRAAARLAFAAARAERRDR